MIKNARDPKSVAEGLLKMIVAENKREMAVKARKTVKKNFVLSQQAEKYINCFSRFMKKNH
jgi:spore maturation protein CgeB